MPILAEPFVIAHRKGPWSHETHVAFQNIEQLWQFVDARFPQQPADGSNARISFDFEHRPTHLIQVLQLFHLLFRIYYHCPELIHEKLSLIVTDPLLRKEN